MRFLRGHGRTFFKPWAPKSLKNWIWVDLRLHFGGVWEALGRLLGALGLQFGSRWFQDGTWSLVWSLLGPAWLHFGTSGVLLGTPWAFLGASLPLLGPK